ncbi:hypothetical protein ABZP36_029978 [Zizania latifolia]
MYMYRVAEPVAASLLSSPSRAPTIKAHHGSKQKLLLSSSWSKIITRKSEDIAVDSELGACSGD